MKLAYIMSRFPKFSETFVLLEMLGLKNRGVEIQAFPLLREKQTVVHDEVQEIMPHVTYAPLLSPRVILANLWCLIRHPALYVRTLAEILRGTAGSLNFFLGGLGIFPKAVFFAQQAQQADVTHVHAHFATHPTVAALVVHRLTGIPFSFTAHGSDLHVEQKMLEKKIAAAKFAVMISKYNLEFALEHCGEKYRDKLHIVHCGICPDTFIPRDESIKDERRPATRIICVATFREVKGHTYLVEACRHLAARKLDFSCHLIGDGPLRRAVNVKVAECGLQDQVILRGAMDRAAIAREMQQADIFVLPSVLASRGNREGIPVVLMEAMATGLPVVASRLSGIPERVKSGETGILVPPRDSQAIADALETLIRDAELRGRMGRKGRQKVIAEFDLEKNLDQLITLFQ